jgi:UDP-N-acetylmuramoyl-L-alanine---L-glutamate ligase
VLRPRGFADLTGLTVGIWGVGIEGWATVRRLAGSPGSIHLVDDVADPRRDVVATADGGTELLAQCDVVLKSPGISRRRPEMAALAHAGVCVTSALNLWMWETDRSRVIAVTGTKGKSTTTSLITFFLRAMGVDAESAGNIGQPPYDPEFGSAMWTVVEVSSFQATDVECAPSIVVVTSLGVDHLDWHGSPEEYWRDKLSLTRAEGPHTTLLADDDTLLSQVDQIGGDREVVEPIDDDLAQSLGLLGRHNDSNVALALEAVALALEAPLNVVAECGREHSHEFVPLPGRLTLVRTIGQSRFVDDGLATSVLPTTAALRVFEHDVVALIAGGFDRGIDYEPLAVAIAARESPTTVITLGDAGARIASALARHTHVRVVPARDMDDAVNLGWAAVSATGVVLLSPAAPSFDSYANWEERSADFARVVRRIGTTRSANQLPSQ